MLKTAFKRYMIMAVLMAAVMVSLFTTTAMAHQQKDRLAIAIHRNENTLVQGQPDPNFLQKDLADFPIPEHTYKDVERADGTSVAPPYYPQVVVAYDKNAYDGWMPVDGVDVINESSFMPGKWRAVSNTDKHQDGRQFTGTDQMSAGNEANDGAGDVVGQRNERERRVVIIVTAVILVI